jgi:cytochrome c peroxidase
MSRIGLALALALPVAASAGEATPSPGLDPSDLTYTYAVGTFTPEYDPPPPGSYRLPVVDTLSDHPMLDADGGATTLFALKRDRLAVVAFVYTTCVEAAGCPLSMGVLHRLDRALARDTALAPRVTLITVSFDPERDPPARMAAVRDAHRPASDWRFATFRDERELAPLLADFGQPVARLRLADGSWTGLFRHVLKVFLVDTQNRVRNVYSVGFLNAELVLNDLRTVLGQPEG